MNRKDDSPKPAAPSASEGPALRRQAEEIARVKAAQLPEHLEALSPEETLQTPHELRVHQIELEVQNEELRRAQAELDASRTRYFDLYDLAPVGYCTLGEKELILEANLMAATLLGVARDALVKQPFTRFILKEDQDIYYLHRKQLLKTPSTSSGQVGEPHACELRMVKKDGTQFWTHLDAAGAQDAAGAPVCRVTLSDITERKRAETEKEKLEAQNRQLQKSESLGRMAGAIAHHFNNQLMVVMGNLELAMEDLPQGAKPFAALSKAMQAAQQAAKVSTLMLTYLGQPPGAHALLDLSKTCRQNLPLLYAGMPKSISLEVELPAPGPAISANAKQIQHVLTNLIANAWEAIGAGAGAIRLAVKTVSAAHIPTVNRFPIDCQPQANPYACLEVADTGCGIADQDVEKLFDPFFSSKFPGRGLGLPVVLGIVRAHEGVITVQSEPGQGSTFRVFLPLSMQAQEDMATPATEFEEAGLFACPAQTDTVLLVEDEEGVRKVTASMLTHLGFTVLVARDGVEALELFRQRQADIRCVLCDLTMPRMDGWQTLAALRKLAPALPVILASGYHEAQVMAADHPERPNAFLAKPYRMTALKDALARALENSKFKIQN